ncbi:MAG TPA: alpha-mannosidase, partial [Mycobacterium sp.]|nr:alpha-mannosidase [Mycobacterium sp.]
MHVISAESTELFAGPADAALQMVAVTHRGGGPLAVEGDGLTTPVPSLADPAAQLTEVPVAVERPVPGQHRAARVVGQGVSVPFTFTVAEPGWTMFMVSHFHYDPVWWNTQGAYTSAWIPDPPSRLANGFELVRTHLEMARRDADYKFVLAEVDYLKPYWDTHPEDRADLRRFLADGRVEV